MIKLSLIMWSTICFAGISYAQESGSGSSQTSSRVNAERTSASAADSVPSGQDLVSIDFPEPTDIKDIIRAVALWTGKNVILGKGVAGKVQMISPRKVTKEEAYQAFLSALEVTGLTTVETGKVIKVMPTRNALKDNLSIYQGTTWAPRTDKLITQIVPLKYIDAKKVQTTLSRIVSLNSMIAYQPTNTLIISDTGFKVRRILEIIGLLDVAGQQPQVVLVPIRYGDAKNIAAKVSDILKTGGGVSSSAKGGARKADYRTYKITVDERSNSVVVFGPPRTIEDVKELIKKFDFPVDDPSNQAAIRVRFLDYADAKKLASTLQSLAQGSSSRNLNRRSSIGRNRISSSRSKSISRSEPPPVADLGDNVKITADESSNALLITGSKSAYEAINNIIRKLDRRRAQVYVEADILDVILNNDLSFETSMILGSKEGDAVQSYGWQGQGIAPVIAAGSGDAVAAGDKVKIAQALGRNFTIGVLTGQSVAIPGIGDVNPGALISMLKEDGNTRILSSPHLLTSNNETAKITVGETLFYKTATQSAAIGVGAIEKVEKEEVDLTIEIKPNISHSGNYVTLKLDLEANEGDIRNGLPYVNKRQTSQLVTVRNGQTAVISGLVKRRESESFQKIPLLGDIPILGWLFRNSTFTNSNSSLMIFLTPNVVYGANDLAAIYEKKVSEREKLLESSFGLDEDDPFLNALPGLDAAKFTPNLYDELEDKRDKAYKKELEKELQYGAMDDAASDADAEKGQDASIEEPVTVPIPMGQDANGAEVSPDVEQMDVEDREAPPQNNDPELIEPGPELDAPGDIAE